MNYAYLRISTDSQDITAQKHGLLDYANRNEITKLEWVEDVVSSRKAWRERKIGDLVSQLKPGDRLLTPEISRLARSTLEALEIIKAVLEAGAELHVTKDRRKIGGDIQDTIYITVLSLAAEIERHFIQKRTTEALAKRKEEIKKNGFFIANNGKRRHKLGRPAGSKSSTLAKHHDDIVLYLKKGLSQRAIAKLLDVHYNTVNKYIKDTRLNEQGQLDYKGE